jgi:phenylpyruvate tautomerase PptA (4-oxalocrotonate tautomerase family)
MPYVEILAPQAGKEQKLAASRAVTDALVSAFAVEPATVTLYFIPLGAGDFAHAGSLAPGEELQRIFVKIHAYRRSLTERRAAAEAVTSGIAKAFQTAKSAIAVYFFDRERDEVAHGGRMSCDERG